MTWPGSSPAGGIAPPAAGASSSRAHEVGRRGPGRGGIGRVSPTAPYDVAVTIAAQPGSRPAGPHLVMLVLAVLFGILGMHALVADGVPQSHAAPGHHAGHQVMAPHTAFGPAAGEGCAHTPGDSDHLNHSDGTCAAAGLGTSYTPPALAGSNTATGAESDLSAEAAAGAVVSRAPPDLSELQLLRI